MLCSAAEGAKCGFNMKITAANSSPGGLLLPLGPAASRGLTMLHLVPTYMEDDEENSIKAGAIAPLGVWINGAWSTIRGPLTLPPMGITQFYVMNSDADHPVDLFTAFCYGE